MSTEPANCVFYLFDSNGNFKAGPEEVTFDGTTLASLGEEARSRFGAEEPYFLCSPDCADEDDKCITLAPSMSPGMYGLPDGARINLVEMDHSIELNDVVILVNNKAV